MILSKVEKGDVAVNILEMVLVGATIMWMIKGY